MFKMRVTSFWIRADGHVIRESRLLEIDDEQLAHLSEALYRQRELGLKPSHQQKLVDALEPKPAHSCDHGNWDEQDGHTRICVDCGAILPPEIDTMNRFLVGAQGEEIRILRPPSTLTPEQALVFAAYLVSLAGGLKAFTPVLAAVENC